MSADIVLTELVNGFSEVGIFVTSGLFLVAGISKWRKPAALESALALFPFLGRASVTILATVIPATEVGVALGALAGAPIAIATGISLLLAFCVMAIIAMRLRLNIRCACFGGNSEGYLSLSILLRNTLVIACFGMAFLHKEYSHPAISALLAATVIMTYSAAAQLVRGRYQAVTTS